MHKLQEGEVAGCLCKNGLYDYATPVVIEGRQLATLFLGQVLHGEPDLEFFRQRARQYRFDEEEYLDAIRAAPVVSKAQMEAHTEAMAAVTQILAANGLARMRETRLRLDLDRSTEQRIQMEDLLEFSPVGISWCDAEGRIEYINRQFTELFGYTLEDVPNLETWISRAYPDAEQRKELFDPWVQRVDRARHLGLTPPNLESTITCKDGRELRVMTRVSWVGDKRLATFSDITAHWRSEQRNRAHNAMLQMVAKAEPLTSILYTLAQAVEAESPSSLCSILLLDKEGKHLLAGAAPRLPQFYIEAVDGIEIGMGVQSCGTAAYLGERVIVEDISTHEFWRSTADLAKKAGLAACWSEPIIGSDGKVLGTFAIFHTEPAKPSMEDIERIAFAANLAAIAIENRNNRDALIRRERDFRTLADNAPVNIARYDREGCLIYANPKLVSSLPGPTEQLLGKRLDEQSDLPFTTCFQNAVDRTIETGKANTYEASIPSAHGNEETHLINMVAERDESGTVVGALVIGQDISERKLLEEQLAAREREFRTLAENAPIHIARYDREGRKIYVNPKLAASFPVPIDRLMGKRFEDQKELPYSGVFRNAMTRTIESGEETSFEFEFPTLGGKVETHLVNMVAERDASGKILGSLVIGLDISERKQLEEQLAESERDFRTLAENVPINIARFDRDGELVYINSRLAVTFPLPIHQLLGTHVSEEGRQPYSDLVEKSVARTLEDGMERSFEIEIPIAGSGYVTHLISMVAERDESDAIIGVLATGMDISERKKLQRELERQARLDFLTGLLNRRYFIELAKMELSRLQRYGGELSLIMFDIDRFKGVNDTHGHKVGDQVLQKIAQVSHDSVREIDLVGRFGGEEFVVLLPHTNRQQAVEAAERLRHAIAKGAVILNNGEPLHFTASFGVVTIDGGPEEQSSIDELLIRADKAMYRAKEEGRNRVCEESGDFQASGI
jgi:diguanylate cyclase (GGDEF)-like protein/PAS domain S-box-containing protein